MHGRLCLRLRHKAQAGGKTQAPQDPQRILPQPLLCRSHTPQDSPRKVLLSAEWVAHYPVPVHGHGVDSEVPAAQVLREGIRERHGLRPPVVPVRAVPAEGGHLHPLRTAADGDRAVTQSCGFRPVAEQRHGLLRPGRGGHIPVLGLAAQKPVPHAAAHAPGLMPAPLQRLQNFIHISRNPGHGSPCFRLHFPSKYTIISCL